MSKKCIFCNNTPDKKGKHLVCNNCSVVLFENDIDFETKKKLITNYLEETTKQIEQKSDYLHFIDQKHFDQKPLEEKEQELFSYGMHAVLLKSGATLPWTLIGAEKDVCGKYSRDTTLLQMFLFHLNTSSPATPKPLIVRKILSSR